MSEHLGKSAEMVVAADSDVRNSPRQRVQKPERVAKPAKARPNPARWVLQPDGRFRWWGGYEWTDHFVHEAGEPDPTAPRPADGAAHPAPIANAAPTAVASIADPMEQLKQLASLRDSGILTESEFAEKKAEILGRI